MTVKKKLQDYQARRDFDHTGEPRADEAASGNKPVFVIQKHDASHLHYDFRIEVDGVLKSWAVPKGPSTDPQVKRLAVPTEDHPLAYADFEGTIPKNSYGGGTVLIWDKGNFENLKKNKKGQPIPLADCLENGHVTIRLFGRKLSGGYSLIRTGKKKDERWLLVKINDEDADARRNPVSTESRSVVSGEEIADIARQNETREAGDED